MEMHPFIPYQISCVLGPGPQQVQITWRHVTTGSSGLHYSFC
jgi:hypothetical protein